MTEKMKREKRLAIKMWRRNSILLIRVRLHFSFPKYLTATLPVLSVSRQELLRNAYSVQTAVH